MSLDHDFEIRYNTLIAYKKLKDYDKTLPEIDFITKKLNQY
jgi:hypothetical protein